MLRSRDGVLRTLAGRAVRLLRCVRHLTSATSRLTVKEAMAGEGPRRDVTVLVSSLT